MSSLVLFAIYAASVIGIVVVYERQATELGDWADALSEENAELNAQLSSLRGSSWTR